MGAALLKDRGERFTSSNYRLAEGRWSDIAASVKAQLLQNNAFKPWEADAISDAMIETVREHGTLDQSALYTKLHARQIPSLVAKSLAEILAKSFS